MENKIYINSEGRKVLVYESPDSIILNLPFIMTQGKRLSKSMPYMKMEKRTVGNDIAAIRLLDFQEYEGVIYLNIEDLQTKKRYNLSWNLEVQGNWYLWSLTDYDTLIDISK